MVATTLLTSSTYIIKHDKNKILIMIQPTYIIESGLPVENVFYLTRMSQILETQSISRSILTNNTYIMS